MRGLRSAILTSVALAVALAAGVPAAARATTEMPVLVGVRATHQRNVDRIIFELQGGLPDAVVADWVDQVTQDGSGRRVAVQGTAFLQVSLQGVLGHELSEPMAPTYGPRSRAFDLPNVTHIVNAGDFEAVVTFGIGLMRRTSVVRTTQKRDPARVIIDVAAAFPTVPAAVAFVETAPATPAVSAAGVTLRPSDALALAPRTVPAADPVNGTLLRLWAGPTADEQAAGLRLERSGSKGFRELRVSASGVARLTLTGRCAGSGKAITVADEIFATLRPLPEVEWVKIYDPAGQTRQPASRSDSIPDCLAPTG
jgi:hypothetical protein